MPSKKKANGDTFRELKRGKGGKLEDVSNKPAKRIPPDKPGKMSLGQYMSTLRLKYE